MIGNASFQNIGDQVHVEHFLRDFIYLFILRERGREGEGEGEKHQCVVACPAPPTGDLACNPGMCPAGNRTGDPLVCRPVHNPLSPTSQGSCQAFSCRTASFKKQFMVVK